jgi:hypothetical protein
MDGQNEPQPEEFIMGIICGEYVYVPKEGVGREDAREDEGEEDVLSFLNPFGDGMKIEIFDDQGQTNTDDE